MGNSLSGIPVTFFLKEKLKLGPQQMAQLGAIVSIPSYVGFLFGYLRDRWRPFGKGDRGYMLLCMPIIAGINFYLSLAPLTYAQILWTSLASGVAGSMLGSAVSGLKISVAQRRLMTGRLVALGGVVSIVPGILSNLGGGWLTHHASTQFVFRICGALYVLATLMAFWRPRIVFDGEPERHPASAESHLDAIRRMARHRTLWPALLILLLWVFAPGWGTPLFYYLTNTVKITPEQYGVVNSAGIVVSALVSVLYGFLCRRIPLRKLLWWGTILGTIGGPVYLLIHSFAQAVAISVLVGLLLGVTNASFTDLLMRSYPVGLEGTGDAIVGSLASLVSVGSNILGSWLYEKGGFGLALGVTTGVSALILPALLLVPRAVSATCDGELQVR